MMLITLAILLPLVHSVEWECQATPMTTVKSSTLPEPIREQLEKKEGIKWTDQTSLTTYYEGFPDLLKQSTNRFFAVCVGLENGPSRHFVNVTYIDGKIESRKITEQDFKIFYKRCHNEILSNSDKVEPEEEDDLDMAEKDENEEEHEDLREAAGLNRV